MNLRVNEIQHFFKMNVLIATNNNKGKQVFFTEELSLQGITNPRNQGVSLSNTHNVNHVHVHEEVVETTLEMSSLQSGKNLPNPYKNHPFHKASIDDERSTIVIEQDNSSLDKDEKTKAELNPNTYNPLIPQALSMLSQGK